MLFVFATSLVPMGARAQGGTAWCSDSFSAGPSGDRRDALVVAALAGAASVEVTILSLVRGGPGRREGPEARPSVSVDVASVGRGATLTLSGPTPAFF